MGSVNNPNPKPSWWKDILNGFIAWIIAFVIYMIPAFAVGIHMGFDLGPGLNDNAEVSRRISQAISEMYGSNLYIRIGYIVVLGILVFWRSSVITRHFTFASVPFGISALRPYAPGTNILDVEFFYTATQAHDRPTLSGEQGSAR